MDVLVIIWKITNVKTFTRGRYLAVILLLPVCRFSAATVMPFCPLEHLQYAYFSCCFVCNNVTCVL